MILLQKPILDQLASKLSIDDLDNLRQAFDYEVLQCKFFVYDKYDERFLSFDELDNQTFQLFKHIEIDGLYGTLIVYIEQRFDLLIQKILQMNPDVNKPVHRYLPEEEGSGIETLTPLNRASELGNTSIIKVLIEHKADVNFRFEVYKDLMGPTALSVACGKKQYEAVKVLLDHKADPNLHNDIDTGPLVRVSGQGHLPTVELLIKHQANINFRGSWSDTALLAAVSGEHLDVVEYLLKNKANPNIPDKDNQDALKIAIGCGNDKIVKLVKLIKQYQE